MRMPPVMRQTGGNRDGGGSTGDMGSLLSGVSAWIAGAEDSSRESVGSDDREGMTENVGAIVGELGRTKRAERRMTAEKFCVEDLLDQIDEGSPPSSKSSRVGVRLTSDSPDVEVGGGEAAPTSSRARAISDEQEVSIDPKDGLPPRGPATGLDACTLPAPRPPPSSRRRMTGPRVCVLYVGYPQTVLWTP